LNIVNNKKKDFSISQKIFLTLFLTLFIQIHKFSFDTNLTLYTLNLAIIVSEMTLAILSILLFIIFKSELLDKYPISNK